MKKRLEAELISIAHRILKLRNLSELKQLHLETQKLYETLSVLKFVEENINIVQPKIDVLDVEQKLESAFDKSIENPAVANDENDSKTVVSAYANDEIASHKNHIYNKEEIPAVANDEIVVENSSIINDEIPAAENDEVAEIVTTTHDKNEIVLTPEPEIAAVANNEIAEQEVSIDKSEPIFVPEVALEKEIITKKDKKEPVQISFDDFKFQEPVFEKKSDIKVEKPIILNEKLVQGINIGLNDKIAFVKHLFGNSNEDYNRVLSQISTFDTFLETVNFVNDFVKPDYNNWNDKDEYVLRFMEAIEKKFI